MKTKTNTEISFSFWLTLFYSIPLLALTDRQTDGVTEERYTRFVWAGGTCPCFAWAGGTFSSNTEISFSFWLTLFYSIPSLSPYGLTDWQRNDFTRFAWAGGTCPRFAWAGGFFSPVVLLCQILVLVGNRFWFYILLMYLGYPAIQLWCCVSFFGSGGK